MDSRNTINTTLGGIQTTPFHTHNGIDSPLIKSSGSGSNVFGGLANTSGTASTPFPSGWSISGGVTGQCTITHNLGNTKYAVTATVQSSASVTLINIYNVGSNSFNVKTLNQTGATAWTATNIEFFFTLVQTP